LRKGQSRRSETEKHHHSQNTVDTRHREAQRHASKAYGLGTRRSLEIAASADAWITASRTKSADGIRPLVDQQDAPS
jgi:hypothetical protein